MKKWNFVSLEWFVGPFVFRLDIISFRENFARMDFCVLVPSLVFLSTGFHFVLLKVLPFLARLLYCSLNGYCMKWQFSRSCRRVFVDEIQVFSDLLHLEWVKTPSFIYLVRLRWYVNLSLLIVFLPLGVAVPCHLCCETSACHPRGAIVACWEWMIKNPV